MNLDKEMLPKHLAIIMDGNGRWAKQQGKPRIFGHEKGAKTVREIIQEVSEIGIPYLTLYAFSTENWKRPKLEVEALMHLLSRYLKKEVAIMQENNIRLNAIGDLESLPAKVRKELYKAMEQTQNNTSTTVSLALAYGGQQELLQMTQQLAQRVQQGLLIPQQITPELIQQTLYTQNIPPVDLLIRTSGECRISNFLLWQIAYAELYFTDILWPDFSPEELRKALANYQNRERRFGKTSEQL
ncbi:di-trans,poly-cis-decaprenylcistransferase [Capnocytophaga sp. oral taxon 863 str. F0517]|uniref:isoprenyl transferase n=1 Tax=Capnocytophaga sp. oral taxon 863 TaxID=1227265 RepID=UPI0003965750|nr:isoprenyl transferase [Capnocytophaga sp. oral taxon 863]ERI62184.1 di-trans,poly-cis-decaprenylcistransferase [Capnocytophaga sp. oral taxon 863 str. F0517]